MSHRRPKFKVFTNLDWDMWSGAETIKNELDDDVGPFIAEVEDGVVIVDANGLVWYTIDSEGEVVRDRSIALTTAELYTLLSVLEMFDAFED